MTTTPTGITTREQAAALADVLHQVRPDWPTSSLMTLLAEHRTHPASFGEICQAAITKAQEADLRTPAAIFNPGPHWPERAKATLPRGPRCADHDTFDAHNCPACWGDVRAGDRPESAIGKHHTPTNANQGQAHEPHS